LGTKKPTSVLTPGQIWHVAADTKTKERNEFLFYFLKERKKAMRQSGSKFPDSLQSMRSRTRCTVPFVADANFAGTGGGVGTLARERAGPTEDSGICLILICFFFFLKKAL